MFPRGTVPLALVVVLLVITTTTMMNGVSSADVTRDDPPPPRRVQDGGGGRNGDPTYSPTNYTSYSPTTTAPPPFGGDGDDDTPRPTTIEPMTIEPTTTADGSSYPPTAGVEVVTPPPSVVANTTTDEPTTKDTSGVEEDGGGGGGSAPPTEEPTTTTTTTGDDEGEEEEDGEPTTTTTDEPIPPSPTDGPTDGSTMSAVDDDDEGGGAPPPANDDPTEPPPYVDDIDDADPTTTTTDPAPNAPTDATIASGEDGEDESPTGPVEEEAAPAEGTSFDPTSTFQPTHSGRRGPLRTSGLTMTLIGIGKIASVPDWEGKTSGYFEDVYNIERPGGMYDVMVGVTVTGLIDDEDWSEMAPQSNDDTAVVVVTYVQETWYSIDESNWEPDDDFVLLPLSTESRRYKYVGTLKSLSGYEYLTDVSEISVATSDVDGVIGGEESSSVGVATTGAIIGVSVFFVVLLLAGIIAGIVRYNRGRYDDGDNNASTGNYDGDDDNDKPPTSTLEYHPGSQQEVRTTSVTSGGEAAWTLGGGDQSTSSPPKSVSIAHDTRTVGTMDYDYVAAFGGAGDHSLSDVGGTVGSRTRQTGAEGIQEDVPTMAPPGSGNTIFSEDLTFDQAYEDVCEVILDVYAPAGKLGVIIDTPDDGAPMIHAIKDDSPIVDVVLVGDKLVAVDDEDVRAMTAIKVSKLISMKMNNPSRKLTIIRQERKA